MKELVIDSLSKTYANGVQALKSVTLTIKPGMFGLLGPNGAGKSTLMRTIATLQEADEGSIHMNGIDVLRDKHEVRKILGFLPQEFDFYPKVTALNLLDHFAVLKGISNRTERKETVEALLKKTNLWDHRKKKLGEYSGGMKQRFGIAQSLLGSPELLIVDEPTAGLDPKERNHFHNLLSELGENMIVILSTHIVDDVRNLCQEMAIIHKGQVVLVEKPHEAVEKLMGKIWKVEIDKDDLETYQGQYQIISHRLYGGHLLLHAYAEEHPGDGFVETEPTLEDVYFHTIPTSEIV